MSYTAISSTSISTTPYTLGTNRYGILVSVANPPNKGTTPYTTSSDNLTITNSSGNYVLGGGGNSGSGVPDYFGGNGGHALQINNANITIQNYGNLLGGGAAGYCNGLGAGGAGGAGGGGGGTVYSAGGGAGGSLVTGINGVAGGGGSGGGGGPGGSGGGGYSSGGSGGTTNANGTYSGASVTLGGGGGYGGGRGYGGGGGGGGYHVDFETYMTDRNQNYNGSYVWQSIANYSGLAGYSILNNGSISALYNSQGGNNSNIGPLFYAGTLLPQNYYIRVNSSSLYGQLYVTGWYPMKYGQPTNTMNILIDPTSTITINTTYKCVLVGNCFSTVTNQITALSNGNIIQWSTVVSSTSPVTVGTKTFLSYDLITGSYAPPTYYTPSSTLSTLVSSQFRHVVLSISGTIHTMYVDGVQVAQNINAPNLFSTYTRAGNAIIGATPNLSQAFRGNIDDLRVYNYAIQAPKVASLYFNRNLIVHYPFDSSANNQTPNYATLTHDATFKGNANTTSSSLVGTAALSLTNTAGVAATNYVLGNTGIPFNPSSGLTISCWVNTTGVANRIMRIFDIAKANGNPGISLDISGTNMLYSNYK